MLEQTLWEVAQVLRHRARLRAVFESLQRAAKAGPTCGVYDAEVRDHLDSAQYRLADTQT